MPPAKPTLGDDARRIWFAGVDAVAPRILIPQRIAASDAALTFDGCRWGLAPGARLWVAGAGKAGRGMAAAFEAILPPAWIDEARVTGLVAIPASDPVRQARQRKEDVRAIELIETRDAGSNFPTERSVAAAERMLDLFHSAQPDDIAVWLISGGASALVAAPATGITLQDKLDVTRWLHAAGATIHELNAVRRSISRFKGGRLAAACGASRLAAFVLSDVMGDPLALIGSGPTVASEDDRESARAVLSKYDPGRTSCPPAVRRVIEPQTGANGVYIKSDVRHVVLGNNATAVEAARRCAAELGYAVVSESNSGGEGSVHDAARRLVYLFSQHARGSKPFCLISGGEPTIELAPTSARGLGGRNQQMVLLWINALLAGDIGVPEYPFCWLAGGTDGEDGPTDAAGGWVDPEVMKSARQARLNVVEHAASNNAYPYLAAVGSLFRTGLTDTNVCDLRILVSRP